MRALILGDGPLGRALADASQARGDAVQVLGRPQAGGHAAARLAAAEVVFDASVGTAVRGNIAAALSAGCRHVVVATTGWDADRAAVDRDLRASGATCLLYTSDAADDL